MDHHLISDIWPRSSAWMEKNHRSVSEWAEANTKCKRKGVVCVVHRLDTRAYVAAMINRPAEKQVCKNVKGACGCLHAEQLMLDSNALDLNDQYIFLVSYSCCQRCAELIVESGCVSVVAFRVLAEHHGESVNRYLEANNIKVYRMNQLDTDVDK